MLPEILPPNSNRIPDGTDDVAAPVALAKRSLTVLLQARRRRS
jgi:hypothetical protein